MTSEPDRLCCLLETAMGGCGLAWSAAGIVGLSLPATTPAATMRAMRQRIGPCRPAEPEAPVQAAIALLQRYFAGEPVELDTLAVDLAGVSEQRLRIYAATRAIGWGRTTTYGELARTIGEPGAAQAVGQAMAQNPVPVIIPCHRVLASGARLGGFSAPGGTVTKERLLVLEAAQPDRGQLLLPLARA